MVYFAGLIAQNNLRPLSKTAGKIQIVDEHDNESLVYVDQFPHSKMKRLFVNKQRIPLFVNMK